MPAVKKEVDCKGVIDVDIKIPITIWLQKTAIQQSLNQIPILDHIASPKSGVLSDSHKTKSTWYRMGNIEAESRADKS